MQYHLNGFRPGDPRHLGNRQDPQNDQDHCDVLIVGGGPAGSILAAQLSVFPGISTCLFEQKSGPLEVGQADGIACRSMEMFESFGFVHNVLNEAYWVNETCFWRPNPDSGELYRADRIQDVEDDLSQHPHVILSQARVQDFLLEKMRIGESPVIPVYDQTLSHIEMSDDAEYPIIAHFKSGADGADENASRIMRAKYLVGCDGARSMVRQSIGQTLDGEAARQLWGVMDVLAVSDFPDMRLKCAIQSKDKGSVLIIPREGGYMVRLYIELDQLGEGERAGDRNVTPDILIAKAKEVFAPYSFECKQVERCSAYEIGQRLCDKFDNGDIAAGPAGLPNIFIAGDACHTHSPKAGQGMNVSMADSFNLGWKLANVIRGLNPPEILHSYSAERQSIAKELIDFDRDMARLFSEKPKTKAESDKFQRYFQKFGRYTAGVDTQYSSPSLFIDDAEHQSLATGLTIGKRFHSALVTRVSDAYSQQLGEVFEADGRWRIFAFAGRGDDGSMAGPIGQLCAFLANDAASPIVRYTPAAHDIDHVIDVRAVFQQSHKELDIGKMHPLLIPEKGVFQLKDYEKIFAKGPDHAPDIYTMRGIDKEKGAVLIVRPDHYVSAIAPVDDYQRITSFFDRFMIASDNQSAGLISRVG